MMMTILAPNNKQKEVIKKLHHEAEEKRAQEKAEKLDIPYINLFYTPINIDELVTLSEKDSRKSGVAIIKKTGKILHTGITNPENTETQKTIQLLKEKGYKLRLFLISQRSLKKAWDAYKKYIPPAPSLEEMLIIKEEALKLFGEKIKNIEKLKKEIATVSTTELLSMIVAGAIKSDASDIHLEPSKKSIRLRYRIDGFLQDIVQFKVEDYKSLLSRIKLLSNLKINIHNISQDGRFTIKIQGPNNAKRLIDIRVSVLPGAVSETVVMRLLGFDIKQLEIEKLGIEKHIFEILKQELKKPNGMILTTGPTGSGKTTTLYSCLNFLNKPGVKIITIENPIEYKLEGISQTQVNIKGGYTFMKGLQAILRQDPDIVMIGEIREKEAASTSIHAALTGHLVFSTIHTNNAADTIPRLIDLGIDKTIIPSAVNAVIAQRLVRKLCPDCRQKYELPPKTAEYVQEALSSISPESKVKIPEIPKYLYKSKGCEKCFGLGYKGRIGIFEIFTINDDIEKLIRKKASSSDIEALAIQGGMITLAQDGILKTIAGITSIEEIRRVVG